MKNLKWVIYGLVVVGVLGLTNSASAAEIDPEIQCTAKLTSGIGPIAETYRPGDTVPYRVTLSVPDDADACTLVNLTVYYFPPPLGLDALPVGYDTPCEAVAAGYGTVIGTIPIMNPGDPEERWDFPYVVTPADAVAGSIKGEMAVTFYAQGSAIQRCDQKTGENFIECPEPCVLITKTVDCDVSKVGDEVIYTICVENCGELELTDVEVTDPHLGGVLAGFPSTLAVGQSVCVDFPYTIQPGDDSGMPGATVENQASVTAIDGCDGETVVTDDSEIVVVNLIHPAMEVTKTCVTDPVPPGGDADFEVVIENTGDVILDYTTDDAEIGPGILNPGETHTQVVSEPVPVGAGEVCNEITVTWTIGGDNPCELDNTGDVIADDCCVICPEPCIEITKTVDCDISKVGDEVIYTICVENCGEGELVDVVVTDPHLGGVLAGFPSALAAGQSVCVDFPYTIQPGDDSGMPGATVEDQASVEANGVCGDVMLPIDDISEIVVVYLIHPAMEVTKTCLTDPIPPGGDADFEVTITNTGDVALNYTTDDAEIGPGSLNPGEAYTQVVTKAVPPGAGEVCNEITVTWTIGGDNPCELDNTGDVIADDCCVICPEPCIEITKTVDCDISKVGDEVIYTICVENCGEGELVDVVVTDPHLGGVLAGFPSALAAGQSVCVDFPYTIQPGDDSGEPGATVEDQASVEANGVCGDVMLPIDDVSEIVVVNLIHPAMEVTKTCLTPQARAGGEAQFEVVIENTGDVALNYTTDDPAIVPGSLNPGENHTQVVTVPVPPDAEEVCNEITVTWTIGGDNPCELDNTDDVVAGDCCGVCNPCLNVSKEVHCDMSKVGDEVIYEICIENCGNVDLTDFIVTDTVLGDISGGFPAEPLPAGEAWCVDFPYTIQPGDDNGMPFPDAVLVNEVTVSADDPCVEDPEVRITAGPAIETVYLVHPAMEVTKTCLTDPVPEGQDADFEVTITNTGDVPLDYTTDDPAIMPGTLAPGGVYQQVVTVPIPPDAQEVCNEITVTWTIGGDNPCELDNTGDVVASDCCAVPGENGCTPGYWKNHPDCWCEDYDPDDLLGDVFTIPMELAYHSGHTMMDALNYTGGRLRGDRRAVVNELEAATGRLLFHAVAGVLNGCHPDVPYAISADAVIEAVNAALATLDIDEIDMLHGVLAEYNERGCPIDAHCRPHEPEDEMPDGTDIIDGSMSAPTQFALGRCVPNPFRNTVKLSYGIPAAGRVKVDIFDVAGRRVVTLLDKQESPGFHSVVWDGKDSQGQKASPGVYFTRVSYNGEHAVNKMILMQ